MPCPHCHQRAPIVYRGVFAYCSACNRPRAPFSATGLNLAGQPSKIGGSVGKVLGWLVMVGGLLLAAAVTLFFQLLLPGATIGWAIGVPLALISLVIGAVLLFGGRQLQRSGVEAERQAQVEALYALGVHRGGTLTAADAARALGMNAARTEELLNELVKAEPDYVSLEFDDEGRLFYLFSHAGTRPHAFGTRYRVEPEGRVRVIETLEPELSEQELEAARHRTRR